MVSMRALILSAGLGNRLKPMTDFIPKPLLPIVDRPVIDINISRLLEFGIENIGFNLFYKPNMIKKLLEKIMDNAYIVTEDKLKGTGGALLNFQEFLKGDFIIHNCDIITNIDLKEAIEFHKHHRPFATMVLTKKSGTNFVEINGDFHIKRFSENESKDFYTFTGCAILSGKIFSYLPNKETFSMIEVYQKLIDHNEPILGIPIQGTWYDIGTHKRYWQVHHDILNKKVKFKEVKINSQQYVHPTSNVQTKNLSGFISIGENCFISDNVTLNNTVVFNNSRILEGNFNNCLLSNKFCIKMS